MQHDKGVTAMKGHSVIRLPEVERRTGFSRPTIYRLMQAGTFPHFVRIGARSIGWVEEEIDRYVESKIATRDRDAAHRQEQDR
jgi:prophage regulatory protein